MVWLNTGLPNQLCGECDLTHLDQCPPIWKYGEYRKLNSGKYEFVSYCDSKSKDFISMTSADEKKVLDELLPEDNGK